MGSCHDAVPEGERSAMCTRSHGLKTQVYIAVVEETLYKGCCSPHEGGIVVVVVCARGYAGWFILQVFGQLDTSRVRLSQAQHYPHTSPWAEATEPIHASMAAPFECSDMGVHAL